MKYSVNNPAPIPPLGPRVRERFDAKWLPDLLGDCWVWVASLNPNGYGQLHIGSGATKRPNLAHRISYVLHRGAIPEGKVIDHLCRNRWCVNPEHLEPVTGRENTQRGAPYRVPNQNAQKTHCPFGHPYFGANLYIAPGTGARGCRKCDHRRKLKWRAARALEDVQAKGRLL